MLLRLVPVSSSLFRAKGETNILTIEFYVNGVSAGAGKGIRLPIQNSVGLSLFDIQSIEIHWHCVQPLQDLTSTDLICNKARTPLPTDIIPVSLVLSCSQIYRASTLTFDSRSLLDQTSQQSGTMKMGRTPVIRLTLSTLRTEDLSWFTWLRLTVLQPPLSQV